MAGTAAASALEAGAGAGAGLLEVEKEEFYGIGFLTPSHNTGHGTGGLARTGTNTGTPREPPKRLLRGRESRKELEKRDAFFSQNTHARRRTAYTCFASGASLTSRAWVGRDLASGSPARSRVAGLARSALPRPTALLGPAARLHLGLLGSSGGAASAWAGAPPMRPKAVSYTHLTLPTKA